VSKLPEPLILALPLESPRQHATRAALTFGRDQRGRTAVWLRCGSCGEAEGSPIELDAPAITIDEIFGARRGWSVVASGRAATCPKCQVMPAPVVELSHATRAVLRLLEAHLQVDERGGGRAVGQYAPGWSDARVAREAGTTDAAVRDIRRRDFAPRLVDAIRDELAADVATMETAVRAECKAIKAEADRVEREQLAALRQLRLRLEAAS
jgi:hypothetical protein